jgi:hypothetical protein
MRTVKIFAKLRAAWVNADAERRELERRIASYNVPKNRPNERRELDRFLGEVLDRHSAEETR